MLGSRSTDTIVVMAPLQLQAGAVTFVCAECSVVVWLWPAPHGALGEKRNVVGSGAALAAISATTNRTLMAELL